MQSIFFMPSLTNGIQQRGKQAKSRTIKTMIPVWLSPLGVTESIALQCLQFIVVIQGERKLQRKPGALQMLYSARRE